MAGSPDRTTIGRLRTYIDLRNKVYAFVQDALTRIKSFDHLFVIIVAVIIGWLADTERPASGT